MKINAHSDQDLIKTCKIRRNELIRKIKQKYPNKKGILLLFSAFENSKYQFRQDSTFYYFTSLQEPAIILSIEFLDKTDTPQTIYIPQYKESRAKWLKDFISINMSKGDLKNLGIDNVKYLGNATSSYIMSPIVNKDQYTNIISLLKEYKDYTIFTTYSHEYIEQYLTIKQIFNIIPELENNIIDISDIIAQMRRTKSLDEIENIYAAVDCTIAAHNMAAGTIAAEEKFEFEVASILEFMFKQNGAKAAFPTIVAGGSNGLVLHYNSNSCKIKKNSLVIVDAGAELNYYCADIARTYPESGEFSKKQREIYQIVLETQEYIETLAIPGYWLNNKNEPNKSLHHLAYKFLEKSGYAKYFTHSIGHYLGLDVHDVGSYLEPLKEGDVFTIEPGLYIPEQDMAIRIEDDYCITPDGLVCLSEDLAKTPDDIEELMNTSFDFNFNNELEPEEFE